MSGTANTEARCFDEVEPSTQYQLKELIRDELRDANYYYMLAQKAPTPESRDTLLALSADELRHSQSLLASYYLIAGTQYMVSKKFEEMLIPFYQTALKFMFHNEASDSAAYAELAKKTNDACLAELYLRLAEEEKQHAIELRELLTETM